MHIVHVSAHMIKPVFVDEHKGKQFLLRKGESPLQPAFACLSANIFVIISKVYIGTRES